MQEDAPLKILEKHLQREDSVVAAVSGGADSVFLLYLLLQLAKKRPLRIVVAHVNHRLRGRSSDLDEEFVKRLAAKNGLAFECAAMKKAVRGNLEQSAREFRYAFFEKIRKKHRAGLVLTAHHRDDNIETVIFNLTRGSSLGGIRGMRVSSPARHLLRPLLGTGKREIADLLRRKKIRYRTDASNRDNAFSRNLIRNKIIPLLNRVNSNFGGNLLELAGDAGRAADLIADEAQKWLRRSLNGGAVPLDDFLALSPVLQSGIIAALYRKTHGSIKKFNKKHLAQVLQTLQKSRAGLKKEFGPHNFLIVTRKAGSDKRFFKIAATH